MLTKHQRRRALLERLMGLEEWGEHHKAHAQALAERLDRDAHSSRYDPPWPTSHEVIVDYLEPEGTPIYAEVPGPEPEEDWG